MISCLSSPELVEIRRFRQLLIVEQSLRCIANDQFRSSCTTRFDDKKGNSLTYCCTRQKFKINIRHPVTVINPTFLSIIKISTETDLLITIQLPSNETLPRKRKRPRSQIELQPISNPYPSRLPPDKRNHQHPSPLTSSHSLTTMRRHLMPGIP